MSDSFRKLTRSGWRGLPRLLFMVMVLFYLRIQSHRLTEADELSGTGATAIGRTALYDEVFNHPVKQGTVIMAGFSQTYEVVPVNGGVIVEFHFHRPEVGFNQGKALFFLRQSQEGEKNINPMLNVHFFISCSF